MSTLDNGISLSSDVFANAGVLIPSITLLTGTTSTVISISFIEVGFKDVQAIEVAAGGLSSNKPQLKGVDIPSLGVTSSVDSSNNIRISCDFVPVFGEVLIVPNLPITKGALNEKEVLLTGKASTFDLNFQVGSIYSSAILTYYLKGYNSSSTSYEYWSTLGYPSLIGKEYLTGVSIVGTN